MAVAQGERATGSAGGQVHCVLDVDFAQAITHLRWLREGGRHQSGLRDVAIHLDRKISQHPSGVATLFPEGEEAVTIGVNGRDDRGCHQNTGNEPHGSVYAVLPD